MSKSVLTIIALLFMLAASCHWMPFDFKTIAIHNNKITFSDFAYYSTVTDGFWNFGHTKIYNLISLNSFINERFQLNVHSILPFNLTPLGLFLFPFVQVLSQNSLEHQQIFFLLASCMLLSVGIGKNLSTHIKSGTIDQKYFLLKAFLGIAVLICSESWMIVNILGQSSIFAAALILLMATKSKYKILHAAMNLFMFIKPHYAFIHSVILIGNRKWRQLLLGYLILLICTASISGLLGKNWYHEYLNSTFLSHMEISSYGLFAGTFPDRLPTFKVFIGNFIPAKYSSVIGLMFLFMLSTLTLIKGIKKDSQWDFINPSMFVIAVCSIFSPYYPRYDEILLWALLFLMHIKILSYANSMIANLIILVTMFFSLNLEFFNGMHYPEIYWAVKACLVMLSVLAYCKLTTSST